MPYLACWESAWGCFWDQQHWHRLTCPAWRVHQAWRSLQWTHDPCLRLYHDPHSPAFTWISELLDLMEFASKLKWDSTNRKCFNVFVKQPKCPWCRRGRFQHLLSETVPLHKHYMTETCNDGNSIMCWWNFTRFTSTDWKCHNDNASMYKLSSTNTCTMAVSQKIWT